MIFKFYTLNGNTFIEAIFEEDDNLSAERLEGVGVNVRNRNTLVFFDKVYDDLHPDIIALACLCIFYPFIGKSVTFPRPVTKYLAESINRPIFTKTKLLEITNVDYNKNQYRGECGEVVAFGGGMDSSAVRALFPEAFIVHEASIRDGVIVPDLANEVTRCLEKKGRGSLVHTNSRFISQPGGWHVWTGSIVTSLLEAGQRRAKAIYAGTILGAAFLSNGVKYYDRHNATKWHGESGNYWQQIFWDIGIPLVQPLMGCSEILTMQASLKHISEDEIFFCTAKNGKACGVCIKCLRRSCIKNYLCGDKIKVDDFRNNRVISLLQQRPLYMGHIYATLRSSGWIAPNFIENEIYYLDTGISFANRFYPGSLDFIPKYLRGKVSDVLYSNFEPMSEKDILDMRNWNLIG